MDVHSAPHTGRVQEKSHLYYICGEYRFSPSFLFFYLSFETRITVITVSKRWLFEDWCYTHGNVKAFLVSAARISGMQCDLPEMALLG